MQSQGDHNKQRRTAEQLAEEIWGNVGMVEREGYAPIANSLRRHRMELNLSYLDYLFIEAVVSLRFCRGTEHPLVIDIAREMGCKTTTPAECANALKQVRKVCERLNGKGLRRISMTAGVPQPGRGAATDLSEFFKHLGEVVAKIATQADS